MNKNEEIIYEIPQPPKVSECQLYHKKSYRCDLCVKRKLVVSEEDEVAQYEYHVFETDSKRNLENHYNSKQHRDALKKIEELPEDQVKTCKCGQKFDIDSAKRHREHNEKYWHFHKSPTFNKCSCNNFYYNGIRFPSILSLVEYKDKHEKYLFRKKGYTKILRQLRENKTPVKDFMKRAVNNHLASIQSEKYNK